MIKLILFSYCLFWFDLCKFYSWWHSFVRYCTLIWIFLLFNIILYQWLHAVPIQLDADPYLTAIPSAVRVWHNNMPASEERDGRTVQGSANKERSSRKYCNECPSQHEMRSIYRFIHFFSYSFIIRYDLLLLLYSCCSLILINFQKNEVVIHIKWITLLNKLCLPS